MKTVSREGRDPKIGVLEHHILSAIIRLRADAYGVKIRQIVGERTGRDLAIGALYTTLDRMEKKGFVSSWMGDPTPERGGRRKKYYKLEAEGIRAWEAFRAEATSMWKGLSSPELI